MNRWDLLGMNRGDLSMVTQMVTRRFSYCISDQDSSGILLIGDTELPFSLSLNYLWRRWVAGNLAFDMSDGLQPDFNPSLQPDCNRTATGLQPIAGHRELQPDFNPSLVIANCNRTSTHRWSSRTATRLQPIGLQPECIITGLQPIAGHRELQPDFNPSLVIANCNRTSTHRWSSRTATGFQPIAGHRELQPDFNPSGFNRSA
ncbi:hypothetical protein ZOSMA_313G00310 [Zostera marina]|uniref:Uncharacterized protein n=1 Tax=Zostera marina TaxID=29655 RepID=A0A0K9P9P7_ZOSMR|nr:hypothetical protein ZOSMA_313G00310 [Zostera marina]